MTRKKTTAELVDERLSPSQIKNTSRTPINIVVDNVRSLDNVGLIFRISELALVEKLYLVGYTGYPEKENDQRHKSIIEKHNRRMNKTAVYAIPHQPWEHIEDPVPLVKDLKEKGSQIVVLEQTTSSVNYHKAEYNLPLTIIVGHERQGVREELIDLADLIIDIPVLGHGNSHNVSVSTGIVLYNILAKTGQI